MTLVHGYIDHDFLNNPVNNYMVPFSPYFDYKIYVQGRFNAAKCPHLRNEYHPYLELYIQEQP